jgi:hypothetical protein
MEIVPDSLVTTIHPPQHRTTVYQPEPRASEKLTMLDCVDGSPPSYHHIYHARIASFCPWRRYISKLRQRRSLNDSDHRPCRILSASCLFPNSHAFKNPCSESSMFFIEVMSCAGGLLTRDATITGSVSRMMPSSTSSSTASDYDRQHDACIDEYASKRTTRS